MAEEASGSEHGAPRRAPELGSDRGELHLCTRCSQLVTTGRGPGSDFIPRWAIVLFTIVLAASGGLHPLQPLELLAVDARDRRRRHPSHQTVDYFAWQRGRLS